MLKLRRGSNGVGARDKADALRKAKCVALGAMFCFLFPANFFRSATPGQGSFISFHSAAPSNTRPATSPIPALLVTSMVRRRWPSRMACGAPRHVRRLGKDAYICAKRARRGGPGLTLFGEAFLQVAFGAFVGKFCNPPVRSSILLQLCREQIKVQACVTNS